MKIEGKNAVREALRSDTTVLSVMLEKDANGLDEIASLARKRGVKVQYLDKRVLDKESVEGRHQGVIATVSDYKYCDIDDIVDAKPSNRLVVILDGINDPHNLGSIIRVCECAGVDGIVLGKNRQVQVNETVVRCSAGAVSHVKIAQVTNIHSTIEYLQSKGFWVYCADMDGTSMYDVDLKGDIALVIGGEGQGVSRLTRAKCDGVLSIALKGVVNSLNASVACGIVVYEAIRQRG